MTNHISEELPRLLTGDATRDVVLAAAEHLRSCPDCQQELVSAVVAHASLTSAHRFAAEIVMPGQPDDERDDVPDIGRLPDMSTMFEQVRKEAAAPAPKRLHGKRLLAVAAAAVIVTGGATTTAIVLNSGSSGSSTRQLALEPFGQGKQQGVQRAHVTLVGNNRMRVDATSLPKLDAQHRYEVWLTDDARAHMQSVGFIDNDRTADIRVPSNVMSQYNDIEVSLQKVDQDQYSGVSVLRGAYG